MLFEAANSRSVIVALSLPTSTRYPFGYYTVALFLGLERETRLELATFWVEARYSAIELFPRNFTAVILYHGIVVLVNMVIT